MSGGETWTVNFAHRIAALAVQDCECNSLRHELRRSRDAHNAAIRERDALKDEVAGFEWGWEQREKAHDAEVAEAKRDAFKSGMVYGINAGPDVTIGDMLDKVDAQYPATPSGETKCADVAGCDGKCCATPSPEAREVPSEVVVRVETRRGIGWYSNGETIVRITPADAKRIVALARTGGTE